MNALEAASLVMIPSGYEDGTLGSLKPIDGSGDFTFTRGTDIGATRVAEDGYIEKGYENLLLQSNSFDTTWTTSGTSVTSGQSGYDGLNDAWKLETTSNGNRYLQQLISINSVQSISIYAKSGTTDFLGIQIIGTGSGYSFFNLSNGTLGSSSSGVIDKNIELVNGTTDWYRCSFVINANTVSIRIYPTNADNNFASTTGQNIYIQDAQLNQGLAAMPYLPTTTTTSVGGILANQPRIDYTDGGCGSLLLEGSRTNVIEQSEYFGGSYWTKSGANVVSGFTSPEGLSNAYKLVATSNNGFILKQDNPIVANAYYTNSIYLKRVQGVGQVTMRTVNNGIVNITLTNEWQRFEASVISDSSTVFTHQISLATAGDEIMIFGAQCEQGSYPTSLIPTYGTSVTRAADDALATPTIANTETLTFFTKFVAPERQSGGGEYLLNNSSGSSRIRIYQNTSDSLRIRTDLPAVNFNYSYSSLGISIGDKVKVCLRIENGVMTVFINGVDKNTFGAATINFAKLRLRPQTIMNVDSTIIFPTALSDAECIELTTI